MTITLNSNTRNSLITLLPGKKGLKAYRDDRVQKRINLRKDLAVKSKPPFGMGNFKKGNILIIGEQSAKPPLHPIGQDPFCGMKGSSYWINRELETYNVSEKKLFWINALNLDGSKVDILKIIKLLKPSKVIALGNVAANLCKENNLVHIKIPHPAYWKRFNSKLKYPLIEELL